MDSPGDDTDNCWALRHKIQDLIKNETIAVAPPVSQNIATKPLHAHTVGPSNSTVNKISTEEFLGDPSQLIGPPGTLVLFHLVKSTPLWSLHYITFVEPVHHRWSYTYEPTVSGSEYGPAHYLLCTTTSRKSVFVIGASAAEQISGIGAVTRTSREYQPKVLTDTEDKKKGKGRRPYLRNLKGRNGSAKRTPQNSLKPSRGVNTRLLSS